MKFEYMGLDRVKTGGYVGAEPMQKPSIEN